MLRTRHLAFLALASLVASPACSSPSSPAAVAPFESDSGTNEARDAGSSDADASVSAPTFRTTIPGEAVRKIEPLPTGAVVLREEVGGDLTQHDVARSLAWLAESGDVRSVVASAKGEAFLDVVTHPSGGSTLFVARGTGCDLVRYSANGEETTRVTVTDTDMATDPTDPEATLPPSNVGWCRPGKLAESGRLAADGEAVYLVNRGGSNGLVLFRYELNSGTLTRTLRKPLAQRTELSPIGIIATHSVIRDVQNWSLVPRVVVDDQHRARVFVSFDESFRPNHVNEAIGGTSISETSWAAMMTVAPDGTTKAQGINTRPKPAAYVDVDGIRYARGRVVLVGRSTAGPKRPDGFGPDGYFAELRDGETELVIAPPIDLERGDLLSDVAPLDGDRWLVAGRSGYWQNPNGGSVSEEARSELLVLSPAGAVLSRLTLEQGPRHNATTSIAPAPTTGSFFVGGLFDGPGSHSADDDPNLLRSDGWVSLWSHAAFNVR